MSAPGPIAYLETKIAGETRKFPITGDTAVTIGRTDSVRILLDDESVSRRHALLQRAEDFQYYITDLGSSNGTYVNQKRISSPVILRHGDVVSIGSYVLTFSVESADAANIQSLESRTTSISFVPKLITVMVADIRDFTGLAQRVDPGVLSKMTGTLFRQSGKALHHRGAWAQKYIGDAVMAIWVHTGLKPAAIELQTIFDGTSQVVSIASSLQATFHLDKPIRMGVGINTGLASVGNVGSVASSDYTALGEAVNQAFRLEAATRELDCDIALGQATYHFLEGYTESSRIFKPCTVKLKGYEEKVTAYIAQQAALHSLTW